MKNFAIQILLILSLFNLSAQSVKIDSLKDVLKINLSDTTRIKTLVELRNAYYIIHDRSMVSSLADSIRSYSKRANFLTGLGLSYYFISDQFQENGQIDSALFYDKEALKIFKTITYDPKKIIQTYSSLAGLYYMKVDMDSSIFYLKSALNLSIKEEMQSYYYIGANIGMFYSRLGKYDSAISYLNQAISIGEKKEYFNHLPLMYSSLADCYQELGLEEESLSNFKKAYNVCLRLGDERNLAAGNAYFGKYYLARNLPDSALYFYEKAYDLNKEAFPARTAGNLNQISICHLKLGNYKRSVNAMIMCFNELSKYQFPKTEAYVQFADLAFALYSMGANELMTYMVDELGKSEVDFLKQGLVEAENERDQKLLRDLYETYSRYFELKKDFHKALNYMVKAELIEDSIFTLEKTKELAELEKKYQGNLKDEQLKLKEQELRSSKTQRDLFALTVGLLGLLGSVSFAFYRTTKSKNRQLEEDLELKEALINEGPFLSEKTIILKNKKVLKLGDILYIKSAGNELEYHLQGHKYPITERQTIKAVLEQLPERMFVQSHRSHVINVFQIKELNRSTALMSNNEAIPISPKYYANIERVAELVRNS